MSEKMPSKWGWNYKNYNLWLSKENFLQWVGVKGRVWWCECWQIARRCRTFVYNIRLFSKSDSCRLLSAYRRTVSRTRWLCSSFDRVSTSVRLSETITTALRSREYTSSGVCTQCLTCMQWMCVIFCVTGEKTNNNIKTKHQFWATTAINWHLGPMWQNKTFILKRKELICWCVDSWHSLCENLIECIREGVPRKKRF